MFGIPRVLHASGIAVALRALEVIGVENDLVETLVPVQLAQVQQWQLRLGGEKQALLVVQLDPGEGGQVLVEQEQDAGFAQPLVFGIGDAIEHRQAITDHLPLLWVDRVARECALAPPGAEGPHVCCQWALAVRPRRLRSRPRIIGTRDSRMMATTISDRCCLMNGTLPKK